MPLPRVPPCPPRPSPTTGSADFARQWLAAFPPRRRHWRPRRESPQPSAATDLWATAALRRGPRRPAPSAAAAAAAAALLGAEAAATEAGGRLPTLGPICDGCLREPLERDYFGVVSASELPTLPPTLHLHSDLADFRARALRGEALLIRNASDGTAMAGWSCERLAEEFPEGRMRREYDWAKNPEDQNLQRLGDLAWTSTREEGEEQARRRAQDPNAPLFAPFYWGVREYRSTNIGPQAVVKKIRKLIKKSVPLFMDKENGKAMFENAELWLGANGTGARAHMDSHCISTLSIVLKGERRWRIGPPPRLAKGAGRSRDDEVVFDDGVAYQVKWTPMFEFTAKEGDAVLFPPGWIHETLNVAEGCTAALTTQFTLPRPTAYYRSYYNRLRRIGDMNSCWREMRAWASLGRPLKGNIRSEKEARAAAEKLFAEGSSTGFSAEALGFYDLDGDGSVSRAEFVDTFVAWWLTEEAVKREKPVRMPAVDVSFAPEAAGRSDL
eukprot:TRINITY_DN5795_c0_g1_i2.p1 TRINITY_DN5795_c0_g1~~TRINITY_DN5795_c0_g1_i2.p1  ORF type:complete len:498 (-),score=98.58 TRINITY_DN5795_c0_g1_i2:216-1709(-)